MSARCSHSHVGLREQLRDPTPGKGASGVKGTGVHASVNCFILQPLLSRASRQATKAAVRVLPSLVNPACLAAGNRVGKRHCGRRN